jgi:signal transduction histidine kinase
MAHGFVKNQLSAHQQSIRTAYGVLGAGLLLMIAINLAAYGMFQLINDHYRRQDRALVNCKLEVTNAHLLFQEIMADAAAQDMNEVWQKLNRATAQAEIVAEAGVDQDVLGYLEAYRQSLLAVNADVKKAEGAPVSVLPDGLAPLSEDAQAAPLPVDSALLWSNVQLAYDALLKALDGVEGDFAARMTQKTWVVNLLYFLLFAIMLVLFGVLVYTIRAYVGERRRAEALLTESRDSLKTIFDSLNAVVLVVNPQGGILECNQAAAKYFGWNREKIVGEDLWARIPWLARFQQELSKVFYSGTPVELYRERIVIGTTERAYNISMRAAPALSGVVLRMDDVTMQEVQEVHARQTQQMHLLRNLVRSLANDFNNVLGAISGTLSLLRFSLSEEVAQAEEFSGHLATMEGAMERAAIMVRQMTALAGEPDAVLQPLDIGERLRHVLNVVRNNLPGGIDMRAELPKGRALVKAHDRLLEQVVINLVDNAVAAMADLRTGDKAGQGTLTIHLDQVIPDHEFRNRQPQATAPAYWVVNVGDSGPGMTPDVVARIFEPFFTTKTVTRSAGLGLSLVGEIVERLKGFIEVRSAPGKGTIISVYVPELADINDFLAREAAVAEGAAAADGGIPMGSGLILVVDDEPVMRKTAANILAKLGYEVVVAEGGREALALFRQRHAEIVLVMLDLAMPEMGGKETFLAMREVDPSVSALMASGYQQDELVDEALQIGIAGFIRKPYRLSTLAKEIDRIRRLVAKR